MPTIRIARADARARLKSSVGQGYRNREPYRQAIQGLSGDAVLEIEPEAGETLRQIRMRLARAANEVGKRLRSGETQEGTLLAWLAEPTAARRRGRRRTAEPDPDNMAAQVTP